MEIDVFSTTKMEEELNLLHQTILISRIVCNVLSVAKLCWFMFSECKNHYITFVNGGWDFEIRFGNSLNAGF